MDAKIRRVLTCGACGAAVTFYHIKCPYCHCGLEPAGDILHILPSANDNSHAASDAKDIEPYLESLGEFDSYYPDQIDWLIKAVKPLREHRYLYREYIIDLLSLIGHFRSVCLDGTKDTRETHLEVYKRLDAIYNSLLGNTIYS